MTVKCYKKLGQNCAKILTTSSGGSRISLGGREPLGGRGPPTQALLARNVCKNERIGSHSGGVRRARPLDPPMTSAQILKKEKINLGILMVLVGVFFLGK